MVNSTNAALNRTNTTSANARRVLQSAQLQTPLLGCDWIVKYRVNGLEEIPDSMSRGAKYKRSLVSGEDLILVPRACTGQQSTDLRLYLSK